MENAGLDGAHGRFGRLGDLLQSEALDEEEDGGGPLLEAELARAPDGWRPGLLRMAARRRRRFPANNGGGVPPCGSDSRTSGAECRKPTPESSRGRTGSRFREGCPPMSPGPHRGRGRRREAADARLRAASVASEQPTAPPRGGHPPSDGPDVSSNHGGQRFKSLLGLLAGPAGLPSDGRARPGNAGREQPGGQHVGDRAPGLDAQRHPGVDQDSHEDREAPLATTSAASTTERTRASWSGL